MFEFIDEPNFKLVFAVVILFLVLFAAKLAYGMNQQTAEHATAESYSAGATMRFSQEPTATNQSEYKTGYNYEVLNPLIPDVVAPAPASDANASEHFAGSQDQEAILAAQLYNEGREHMSPEEQVASELAMARGFSA